MFAALLSVVLAGACSSVKMAKNTECVIEEFSIMEYPDVKIDRNDPYIVVHMPEEVSDLRMTPIFTISQGATIMNEGTESGVKRDLGDNAKVTVVSEDGLYLSTYSMSVAYDNNRLDFNSVELPQDGEKYGENLSFSFVDFPGTLAEGEPVKWNGFAMSNHLAPDMANPPADAGIYTYRLLEERTRKPAEAVRETVILEVDAQPGNYEWGIPGMEEAPCMKIREEGEEAWTNVPFNKIEGFAYTKDWSYQLSVEKITLEEKPDGEQCQTVQYVLKEILSKSAPLGN